MWLLRIGGGSWRIIGLVMLWTHVREGVLVIFSRGRRERRGRLPVAVVLLLLVRHDGCLYRLHSD